MLAKKTVINHILASGLFLMAFLVFSPVAFAQNVDFTKPPSDVISNVNTDINGIVKFVINGLIIVGIVLSLVFLLYGGIRWVMSGGDKAKVDSARGTIVAAIVGLIIVILAYVIINAVFQILTGNNLGNFQFNTLSS
jgi:hypothetical protein